MAVDNNNNNNNKDISVETCNDRASRSNIGKNNITSYNKKLKTEKEEQNRSYKSHNSKEC